MSDNLRQYRAIRAALIQGYPGEPTGRLVRHLTTLAAFISGIVASKSTQLPHIATQVPDGQKPEPRQTLCQMARQRAYLGGDVLFTVCRDLIDALSRRDTRVGDGWEWGGPRLCGVDDPCAL